MITNYYTLRALVEEWRGLLEGATLGDVFSQEPGELTLAFTGEGRDQMIRLGVRLPFQFMFRVDGYSKARRNVATLFSDAFGRTVSSVSIANLDRIVYVEMDDGRSLHIPLFGPHANVLLVAGGRVIDTFQHASDLAGSEPPRPRPAPLPDSFEAFESRWRTGRKSVAHAVASAFPLLDRTLGTEIAARAGIDADRSPELSPEEMERLFEAAAAVRQVLEQPAPRIYWDRDDPIHFSLLELHHVVGLEEERFDRVDDAARVFVRRYLARRRFRELYEPIEQALVRAADHHRTSMQRMLEELSNPSRAEQYERWGHLLMAGGQDVQPGADEAVLADLFEGEGMVSIPLDPALTAVANAQRYYDRARRTRRSREEAERRLLETERRADEAERLLQKLREVRGIREIREFKKQHGEDLAPYLSSGAAAEDAIPFRRFDLPGDYQVWVGRNARQNDDLTFHHAQKYDLWMHARGVPGSHAVLRLPNRDAEPGRAIVQQAASIAAYFSKARGSGLVPVIVTQRKYVRKPRGAPPGAVAVEREDVLLVEPGLPK